MNRKRMEKKKEEKEEAKEDEEGGGGGRGTFRRRQLESWHEKLALSLEKVGNLLLFYCPQWSGAER